ncbi:hypothetical protein L873DRAFT_1831056 [Choiromyces venosus 120613-1]|uniref:MFS general substrate transporter n=1 Tax=Choiromyces venosus 120613-1 TaxID=1336337 RepID=A0A3N4J3F2_9PEZI|nr:hypothetical protein L873DRAFT_1831056 [Choiromyces venosus 120613-1]
MTISEKNKSTAPPPSGSLGSNSSIDDVEPGAVVGDYGSQGGHIFEDEKVAAYWAARFGPGYKWTAKEKRLLGKIDWRIMLGTWIMFFSLGLNRRNINRAISDNMIFLVSFLSTQLPSDLSISNIRFTIVRSTDKRRWIPFIILVWAVISASQAALTSKTGYYICRALLGLAMGGFTPDTRMQHCLIAAGILNMRGLHGWGGFLIEGTITGVIDIAGWALMPPGPCQTASWARGKAGWFTEHEEYILVNKLLRDDPSKGDMHNRQAVGIMSLLKSLKDYDLWPLYLLGLVVYIPPQPPTTYIALILRNLGFSVFHSNLLTIPSQFLFAVNLLIISRVSEWINERMALPADANPWIRYVPLTSLLSCPYCHAILVAWNSRNSNTVRTRAVSAALYNINIYRDDDKPLYRKGNKILLGICCFSIVLFVFVKYYYIRRNARREIFWDAMSGGEREEYIAMILPRMRG